MYGRTIHGVNAVFLLCDDQDGEKFCTVFFNGDKFAAPYRSGVISDSDGSAVELKIKFDAVKMIDLPALTNAVDINQDTFLQVLKWCEVGNGT